MDFILKTLARRAFKIALIVIVILLFIFSITVLVWLNVTLIDFIRNSGWSSFGFIFLNISEGILLLLSFAVGSLLLLGVGLAGHGLFVDEFS